MTAAAPPSASEVLAALQDRGRSVAVLLAEVHRRRALLQQALQDLDCAAERLNQLAARRALGPTPTTPTEPKP